MPFVYCVCIFLLTKKKYWSEPERSGNDWPNYFFYPHFPLFFFHKKCRSGPEHSDNDWLYCLARLRRLRLSPTALHYCAATAPLPRYLKANEEFPLSLFLVIFSFFLVQDAWSFLMLSLSYFLIFIFYFFVIFSACHSLILRACHFLSCWSSYFIF